MRASLSKIGSFLSHATTGPQKVWVETIASLTEAQPTKSLLLKAKKDASIFVLALNSSEVPISSIVKSIGQKDARLANEDYILSVLGVSKEQGLTIVKNNYW
jgi:hypothetical protein